MTSTPGRTAIYFILAALLFQSLLMYVVFYQPPYCPDILQRAHNTKSKFPKQDEHQLVDLNDFSFIRDPQLCSNSDVFLLVLINSAIENSDERKVIRQTWGSRQEGVKLAFLVGQSERQLKNEALAQESDLHKDIIQGNFIDAYKNLTYKTVMGLKYVTYHCHQAIYVLKMDDDSFVNMPLLKNFLRHDVSPLRSENLFLCNDMTGSPALRDRNSKWYVPEEDFADEYYPTYCSGWYAVLSTDVCLRLYEQTQKLKYFYIDDVFVYGIAAQKANLSHVDMIYHTLTNRNIELLFNGSYDDVPLLFGSPNMRPEKIRQVFGYFKNRPVPESLFNKFKKH